MAKKEGITGTPEPKALFDCVFVGGVGAGGGLPGGLWLLFPLANFGSYPYNPYTFFVLF